MYIIVAGGGQIGSQLVKELVDNKHDVVVIEKDQIICDEIYVKTGAVVINGGITSISTLKEANIEKADVAVATADNDADNLSFALLCKTFNVPRIIARMRNPEYEKSYKVAGVNAVIRVTDLLVNRLMVAVEDPEVNRITTLGDGKADIFKLIIPQRAKILGKNIKDIVQLNPIFQEIVFIAIIDPITDEFIITKGNTTIKSGQEIIFLCSNMIISKIVNLLTEQFQDRRNL